jgi:hypothetical protein
MRPILLDLDDSPDRRPAPSRAASVRAEGAA